ncbi:hypothetical protein [Mucilaginibacter psychrotolerans]|uniref:Uncharacterized protein n=1 Tax=Mucilaginibacter psychrotolerans TaxID=1524096 RepID=A0A4Y8SBL0_9SPHI|nr:hypothetical protein [Mucilaginibacter psychrotolerans]TFF36358.1 hypothetical protein E2R66_16110 [Mucilaginibacter psychrotolerans]
MQRIILEVDDTVGKAYQGFSKETKQQFNNTVSLMVKKALNDATFADYSKLLDDVGNEAIKNGLTPEILEALLADND